MAVLRQARYRPVEAFSIQGIFALSSSTSAVADVPNPMPVLKTTPHGIWLPILKKSAISPPSSSHAAMTYAPQCKARGNGRKPSLKQNREIVQAGHSSFDPLLSEALVKAVEDMRSKL